MHSNRMNKIAVAVLVCAAGIPFVLSTACNESNSKVAYANRLTGTGEPALHAVRNAQLRELMGEINQLATQGDYARPLELAQKEDEAVRVGEALVKDAGMLQGVSNSLELTDEERMVYEKMAVKLERQAVSYLDAAKNKDFDRMNRTLDGMVATCDACHATFRNM